MAPTAMFQGEREKKEKVEEEPAEITEVPLHSSLRS